MEVLERARRHRAALAELTKTAEENNIGLGELIHVFTDYMGFKQCTPCARRQRRFDKVQIPTKFVLAELVNKAKRLRNPKDIQVTWIDGD